MGYSIQRKRTPGGDGYCLVDEEGNVLPHQVETVLRTTATELPTFTVVFQAGEMGLRVVDEDEE